jgi:Bacterial regulatory helix-turn-helix protein, lysR family
MIENFKLHVFRVVADTLNFSKAAEELHLSQSAVTSQVRSLEERLGIALSEAHRSIGVFPKVPHCCMGRKSSAQNQADGFVVPV